MRACFALLLMAGGCASAPPVASPPAAPPPAAPPAAAPPSDAPAMDHAGMDHRAMGHTAAGGMSTNSHPDVRFMQDMIPHHAQALDMAALVPGRDAGREVTLMAERIRVSQTDEIARMSRWLVAHDADVPDPAAHAGHLMAGMLTPAQMADLAAATGPDFDRLFLTGMIQHHQGALTMVGALLDTPGGAQASDVFQLATDIDADQTAEIGRMQSLLTRF